MKAELPLEEDCMSQIELSRESSGPSKDLVMGTAAVGVPVLLTAIRCTLLYILVPFVLPAVGISGVFSPIVNIGAGFIGIALILYNIRHLWHSNWRKRYLLLSSVIIPFILVSMYFDYLSYLAI